MLERAIEILCPRRFQHALSTTRGEGFSLKRGLRQGRPTSVVHWSVVTASAGACLAAFADDIICVVVLNSGGSVWILDMVTKIAAIGMILNMSKVSVTALHRASLGD